MVFSRRPAKKTEVIIKNVRSGFPDLFRPCSECTSISHLINFSGSSATDFQSSPTLKPACCQSVTRSSHIHVNRTIVLELVVDCSTGHCQTFSQCGHFRCCCCGFRNSLSHHLSASHRGLIMDAKCHRNTDGRQFFGLFFRRSCVRQIQPDEC